MKLNRVTSAALAVAVASGSIGIVNQASAAITLNEEKKVKLFGDMRFRAERDTRSQSAGDDQNRNRFRVRARIGMSFMPNDKWMGRIRMATNSTSLNSPYHTLSTSDPSKNGDFGLDQAYLAYMPTSAATIIMGKTALNWWKQNELFWDDDINAEAIAGIYKMGNITFNAAYAFLDAANWGPDIGAWTYQGVYKGESGGMKYTGALGGASVSFSTPGTYEAKQHVMLSGQIKTGAFLFGADYLSSDASTNDVAYVVQGRYKINNTFGLRAYYYHVEAFAPLGDGTYSQDNFPNPGSTGVSNFKGPRFQLDYKIDKGTSLDLRYYMAKKVTAITGYSGASDAIMSRDKHNRLQMNITVKF